MPGPMIVDGLELRRAPGLIGEARSRERGIASVRRVAPGVMLGLPQQFTATSARTLILGLDEDGRIADHDRLAAGLLDGAGGSLLGLELASLMTDRRQAQLFGEHLDAVSAGRDVTTVAKIKTARLGQADAVITLQPVSSNTGLAARAIVRIAPPAEGRFADTEVMRRALLDVPISQTGGGLGIEEVAPKLTRVAVPHFCNVAGLVVRESLIADDELAVTPPDGSSLLRRMAVETDDGDPRWSAGFPTGELLHYPGDSLPVRCIASREPVIEEAVGAERGPQLARAWHERPTVAELLTGTSVLFLPLAARGVVVGLLICIRKAGYRSFDAGDAEIGREFAARAAVLIDNARRYSRERATALTLQRSLLPADLSAPPFVEVCHRYLPAGELIEVGGDWYEAIALPGGRAALAVGDVAGHGVRAAVTMGRLRTAIRTLARLELPPGEMLEHLDELMGELGMREPHFATCVYAVFDTVTGTCELASAGHLPPLLIEPGAPGRYLDLPTAPPLGVGSGSVQSSVIDIPDGSLLVLYTDGLVERRGDDIDAGLARLRELSGAGAAARPLDDLCQAALAGVDAGEQRDDIAVLIARLRRLPPDRHVSWTLRGDLRSVHRARSLAGPPLRRWGLASLIPDAELVISELVTNAVRYATGDVGLRLVLEDGLFCEVRDNSAALPRLREVGEEDGSGLGLLVVSQVARRWGTRRTPPGKVVWCELPVRAGHRAATRREP
jgi:serine phosphatase RsbU (regulator of sigma subunit)/anti-sigma regulatory factor (Ser/Thr protein kinase)